MFESMFLLLSYVLFTELLDEIWIHFVQVWVVLRVDEFFHWVGDNARFVAWTRESLAFQVYNYKKRKGKIQTREIFKVVLNWLKENGDICDVLNFQE